MYNQEQPEMGFSHKIAEVFYGIKNVLSSRSALALAMGTIAILDIGLKVPPEDVSMIRGTHTEACDATPQIPKLEGIRIVDANIAGNSAYAQHLIYKYRPTIANFQEVGGDKAQQIVNAKPCYDGLFGMADFKVNVLGGGQGNLIVNQLKRSSDEYKYVQQPLPDMGELFDGIIHWDKYKILDSYKESRSTLIGTYEVKIADKKVNINIANIHAASGPVGDRQLKRFIPFIDSSMSRSGEINLVIGDTNRTPKFIRQMLGGTASKWVVKNIGPTSRNSGDQIDQLIYRPTVTVDDQPYSLNFDTTVLPDKGSDHYGILIEPSTKPIINYPKILTLAIKNKIIANSAPEATPQSVHEPK